MAFPWLAAATLGVGALGFFGQKETNQANVSSAQQVNQFSAEQAEINRSFQSKEAQKSRDWMEEMSNTSIQRARADMEAAGFNPLLALPNPASTPGSGIPGGSSAQGQYAMQQSPEVAAIQQAAVATQMSGQLLNTAKSALQMPASRMSGKIKGKVEKIVDKGFGAVDFMYSNAKAFWNAMVEGERRRNRQVDLKFDPHMMIN